jgi:Rrf2 family protein
MKKSTKLSDILHILLHMADSSEPVTSEQLAKSIQSNPAFVRRTMGGLRELGLVQSEKGHHGGWTLSCDLAQVTLYDIYQAVDAPTLIALGNRAESSTCLVEQAVNETTGNAFERAEALILEQFRHTTLADLLKSVKQLTAR